MDADDKNEPTAETVDSATQGMQKLSNFVRRDYSGDYLGISLVAVKDGIGYATDGRIAIGLSVEGAEDSIPEKYPLGAVKGFLGIADSVEKWYAMDHSAYEDMEAKFLEKYRMEQRDSIRAYRDRYKVAMCPCCNEDLYWDCWENRLVEEDDKEEYMHMTLMDAHFPVRLEFDTGGILVNFGYLVELRRAIGKDIVFAPEPNADRRLLFRSAEGRAKGVGILMPLRGGDGGSDASIAMLEA